MRLLALGALLLPVAAWGSGRTGGHHRAAHRWQAPASDDERETDSEDTDDDATTGAAPPPSASSATPPGPPTAMAPPAPPSDADYTFAGKQLESLQVLHEIARRAGWSLVVVSVGQERVDLDIHDADPKVAADKVLTASGSLGILRRRRLVVIRNAQNAGLIVRSRGGKIAGGKHGHSDNDRLALQGDVVIPPGMRVRGDVVALTGNVELQPGAVVEGDAISMTGRIHLGPGALVMGDATSGAGTIVVDPGAEILGEQIHFGLHGSSKRGPRIGPLGLGAFRTLALFSLLYLIALVALRFWPERVDRIGEALLAQPLRSLVMGLLCALLVLPMAVLLAISIVGIPLLLLLPLTLVLGVAVGLCALGLRLGERLPAGEQPFAPPVAMGFGFLILAIATFLPVIGLSLIVLAMLAGVGATALTRLGSR